MPEIDIATCHITNHLPLCPFCGDLARPNILMFDDWYWIDREGSKKKQTQINQWLKPISNLAIIEIGAGTAIPTVRLFSEQMAWQYATKLIRINHARNAQSINNDQHGRIVCITSH